MKSRSNQVDYQVWLDVRNQIQDQVDDQVWEPVGRQVYHGVNNHVDTQVCHEIRKQTR